jgi:hypothetical protein
MNNNDLIRAKRYMQKTILLETINRNIAYYYALAKNLTPFFIGDLRYKHYNGKNHVIQCFGSQGDGKSFAVFNIEELVNPLFTLDYVKFTDYDTLKALSDCPEGASVVKDEQLKTHGEGSQQQEDALTNIEWTVRVKRVNLAYCCPEPQIHSCHYSLEVFFDRHEDKQKTYLWLYRNSKLDMPLGYIVTRLPKIDREAYKKIKLDFVDRIRSQEVGTDEVIKHNADLFLASNYVGALKTSGEIETAIKMDDMFDKGLTQGQIRTIKNYIVMTAREQNIDLFFDEEKRKRIEDKLSKNPKTKGIMKGFKGFV